jgi:hypothetical protein
VSAATETGLLPVESAVIRVLERHPLLKGDRVYQGQAPAGSPLPYAILPTSTEPDAGRYVTQPGRSQVIQVRFWAGTRREAQRCFAEAFRLLHGVALAVDGHRCIRAGLSYVADFKEPTAPATALGPWGVVAELRTDTLET